MNDRLRFRLATHVVNYTMNSSFQPEGPLFHRWLPDGEKDAIRLSNDDSVDELDVWFERRMQLNNGYLQWTGVDDDFDADVMRRQGRLDAGWLIGELKLAGISSATVTALKASKDDATSAETPPYVQLGKRVVKYVQPLLSQFLRVLRDQYGQYWLRSLEPWNSQDESLGSYCRQLRLKWFDEQQQQWNEFVPTPEKVRLTIVSDLRKFKQFLTAEDWGKLRNGGARQTLPIGAELLARAARLLHEGEHRLAFVEASSAVETVVTERLKPPTTLKHTAAALQSFVDSANTRALVASVMRLSGYDDADTEIVLSVVDLRNKVVHDGYSPGKDDVRVLVSALPLVARLLNLEPYKNPEMVTGNALSLKWS
jgi:hypothetical protein